MVRLDIYTVELYTHIIVLEKINNREYTIFSNF